MNPLQRMLGTYLRLERTRLGYTSGEVAGRLGLSDTYLRLAESGRATLNQSLVFKVIEVFADSTTPTRDTKTISFDRLALLMVGIHWLGAEMSAYKGPADPGKRAFEDLASRDSEFQVLYERTKRYFDLKDEDQRAFLESVAAPMLGTFLTARTPLSERDKDEEKYAQEIFGAGDLLTIPTLNVEILLDVRRALAGRPFVHTADIAAKWERERAGQFRVVRGLFQAKTIVSSKNLDDFHYGFLSEKGFAELRLMFTESDSPPATNLKKEFVRLLNRGREKAKLPQASSEEIAKIVFLAITNEAQQQYAKQLYDLTRRVQADGREGYWSFETHTGFHIGFVGHPDENPASVLNLSLGESFQMYLRFEQLWSDVNGKG